MKIGILAVQGDFAAHAAMLAGLGVNTVEVRTPEDLAGCDGLILPGGESTTQLQFLQEEGLSDAIKQFASDGKAIFGTCAGAILLAHQVENPPQESLNAMNIIVRRNAYGRQIDSSIREVLTKLGDQPLEMVFIRAPKIVRTGKGVEVLATAGGDPVLVRQGKTMAATFHPELSDDTRVHQEFLRMVKTAKNGQRSK